jgi:hypothetical protein
LDSMFDVKVQEKTGSHRRVTSVTESCLTTGTE